MNWYSVMDLRSFLVFWMFYFNSEAATCNKKDCQITRERRMKAASCYKSEIMTFPRCLATDIEILELSFNRIRVLSKGDLSNYPSLKYLYLEYNNIWKIDEHFFDDATNLISLDLSINVISTLPPVIFKLPYLSKLYLSQNANIDIVEAVEVAKPIVSPLDRFDISYNDLTEMPNLGEMVYLVEYNVTGNKFTNLTPTHFAGLCNLKYLHNDNITGQFESMCDCWKTNYWLEQRHVKFNQFDCGVTGVDECDFEIEESDLLIYNNCKEKHKQIILEGKLMKIGIPCVVIGVLIILIVIYCCIKKRKQRRLKEHDKERIDGTLDNLNQAEYKN